jgi:hypothetical protein
MLRVKAIWNGRPSRGIVWASRLVEESTTWTALPPGLATNPNRPSSVNRIVPNPAPAWIRADTSWRFPSTTATSPSSPSTT